MSCTDWTGATIPCVTESPKIIPTTIPTTQTTTIPTTQTTFCDTIMNMNALNFGKVVCDYEYVYNTCLKDDSTNTKPADMYKLIENLLSSNDSRSTNMVEEIVLLQNDNLCPFYPLNATTTLPPQFNSTTIENITNQISTTVENNPLITTSLVLTCFILGFAIFEYGKKAYHYFNKKENRKLAVKKQEVKPSVESEIDL